MLNIESIINSQVAVAIKALYDDELINKLPVQTTKKEFEGDYTVVLFPLTKILKKSPKEIGEALVDYLPHHSEAIHKCNLIGGFLNITLSTHIWQQILASLYSNEQIGERVDEIESKTYMVEYSSPNTNKPLHLGHLRNNFLGDALCRLLEAVGHKVIRTNIVNDRGIHICKSMYAWQLYGNSETPHTTGVKGDHFVGDYYVQFNTLYQQQIKELLDKGYTEEEAKEQAPAMKEARALLKKWEERDPDTMQLWEKMNRWVYSGFDETYQQINIHFDKIYYESDTYLHGKEKVLEGLENALFLKEEDGSVWADLTEEGLDKKVLLRADGTSMYITQDIGTALLRYKDYSIDEMVYVVGNEQDYHFKVLAILLHKMGLAWGKSLTHFSYGMVELPHGKMKSRTGTVVDADDLIKEMVGIAQQTAEQSGKLTELPLEEQQKTYQQIALAALRYYILKVDPKKKMIFNPEESIDFNGNTGPFIQYTATRIYSLLRKSNTTLTQEVEIDQIEPLEIDLLKQLYGFGELLKQAATVQSPALVANYCYQLAKEYNRFYHDHPILKASEQQRKFRLTLSAVVLRTIHQGMGILGIELPHRM